MGNARGVSESTPGAGAVGTTRGFRRGADGGGAGLRLPGRAAAERARWSAARGPGAQAGTKGRIREPRPLPPPLLPLTTPHPSPVTPRIRLYPHFSPTPAPPGPAARWRSK